MLFVVSSVCIRSRKGFVERLPGIGESRFVGERAGAELFGAFCEVSEPFEAFCGTSELTCGENPDCFGAEGAVDNAWLLGLGGKLGATGRAMFDFADDDLLFCDETLL